MMKSLLFPKHVGKTKPVVKSNPSTPAYGFRAKKSRPLHLLNSKTKLPKSEQQTIKSASEVDQDKISDKCKELLKKFDQLKKCAEKFNRGALDSTKMIAELGESLILLRKNNYSNNKEVEGLFNAIEKQINDIKETNNNYLGLITLQVFMMEQIIVLGKDLESVKNEIKGLNKNYIPDVPKNILSDQMNNKSDKKAGDDDYSLIDKQDIKAAVTKVTELFSILGSLVALLTLVYQYKHDSENAKKEKNEYQKKAIAEISLVNQKLELLSVSLYGVDNVIKILQEAKNDLVEEKLKLQYKTIFGTFFNKKDERLNQINDSLRNIDIQLAKQQKKHMEIETEIGSITGGLSQKLGQGAGITKSAANEATRDSSIQPRSENRGISRP